MVVNKRDTNGLREYAKKKSAEASIKVDAAIQRLIKSKDRINFNSVSVESGVSKAYLYNNLVIRDRIERLRLQQDGLSSPGQVKREMSNASKDVLIAAKNKRIKELDEENKRLKAEVMHLRGKIYENF